MDKDFTGKTGKIPSYLFLVVGLSYWKRIHKTLSTFLLNKMNILVFSELINNSRTRPYFLYFLNGLSEKYLNFYLHLLDLWNFTTIGTGNFISRSSFYGVAKDYYTFQVDFFGSGGASKDSKTFLDTADLCCKWDIYLFSK